MSENSSVSDFSASRSYVIVAVGILILIAGTIFAYSADRHLEAGDLPADELAKQERIYAVSKIGSMVGFIIAIIPSVNILQNSLLNEKSKAETKTETKVETKAETKTDSDINIETKDESKTDVNKNEN
ncbi:hypothetical protein MmiHf6_05980 [Methanimicrococcus hongohii]|uniref:Uncharacterized protein n=1 Tax=Methanimicrococcus hongohii TaxID=3028295 RepID=A0AA96V038_9EURY|nr:hypothetical protein [Methanimicrococcus sp. Hf6]WNY23293.1 hypothetical protein MmiHf6_05980 [Methanimicrococcus sp. Hf6]